MTRPNLLVFVMALGACEPSAPMSPHSASPKPVSSSPQLAPTDTGNHSVIEKGRFDLPKDVPPQGAPCITQTAFSENAYKKVLNQGVAQSCKQDQDCGFAPQTSGCTPMSVCGPAYLGVHQDFQNGLQQMATDLYLKVCRRNVQCQHPMAKVYCTSRPQFFGQCIAGKCRAASLTLSHVETGSTDAKGVQRQRHIRNALERIQQPLLKCVTVPIQEKAQLRFQLRLDHSGTLLAIQTMKESAGDAVDHCFRAALKAVQFPATIESEAQVELVYDLMPQPNTDGP
jgi:hypothetical protein